MSRAGRPRLAAVGVISLGCPKNLVDTEVMLGLLREAGHRIVSDPDQADVLLVNTCCFIEQARQEAARELGEAIEWRRRTEGRALICAGCWPEMEAPELRERFPEIDAYMGPGDVPRVVSVVERALAGAGATGPQARPASFIYDAKMPRLRATAPWTAYLKIADGCRHRCRFCVIPRLRGRYRSRPLTSIVAEASQLASEGVREVNLVAQDTTAYGKAKGKTQKAKGRPDEAGIAELLSALAGIEGIHWVRLLYSYPTGVTEHLIEVMAREERVCKYLDLPFQHADRGVLRRMGRPGDGDSYLKLIGRLRAAMPDIAIRSSFIVGYPGESEQEFRRLLEFVQAAELDRAGAFCFSPERGTPAAEMEEQVPGEVAQERYHDFMMLQQRVSLSRNRRWVGREMEVLIEAAGGRKGEWVARSFRDAPEIDGTVKVRGSRAPLTPGKFVQCQVTGAEEYDLVGGTLGG
ncbi:MAG: 30S ribosomal protein S12 methylthiotransferase RimO [Armatimonadota bacterium]